MIALIVLNLFFSLNAFVCSKATVDERKNDPLPDSRPEKFAILYGLSGGMMYYSESMYLSSDSCTYEVNDGGVKSKIYFNLSAADLDGLYKIFKDNKFDRIKTYEQEVFDRGGESIYLSWADGKYASVFNGGMTFINDNWQTEWSNCLGSLMNVLHAQLDKQKKDYEVRIDRSFFGKTMNIYIRNETIIPESTIMAESELEHYVTKTIKLMPGAHRVSVSWDKKHYETIPINTDSSKGINLSLVNDSLKTTLINNY